MREHSLTRLTTTDHVTHRSWSRAWSHDHLVTGHVDAVGRVALAEDIGGSTRLEILAGADIAPFVAEKGSITIDGVSLTVNEVDDEPGGEVRFALDIIPHTGEVTTLGDLSEGDTVNLEIDVLARYLKRMQSLAG